MPHEPRSLLAYVHIEKCGGTSLVDALRRTYCLNHADVIPRDTEAMIFTAEDLRGLLRLRPRLRSVSGHSVRLSSELGRAGVDASYVTCLRQPVRRYLSEYYYFVERLGHRLDFEEWLDREDRHNFQTRAIAGAPDVKAARSLLDERFSVVGTLEEFDEFFERLRLESLKTTGRPLLPLRGVLNPRRARAALPSPEELLEDYGHRIEQANELDLSLYRHAVGVTIPRQREESRVVLGSLVDGAPSGERWHDPLSGRITLAVYRLYRNLVYKPYVGRWPGPHSLPVYERPKQAA